MTKEMVAKRWKYTKKNMQIDVFEQPVVDNVYGIVYD